MRANSCSEISPSPLESISCTSTCEIERERKQTVQVDHKVQQQLQDALKTIKMMEKRERKHLSELEAAKDRESMLLARLRIGEENLQKCLTELAQAKVEIGDLQRQL